MSEFTGMNKLEAMAQIAKVGYDEGVKDEYERIVKLLEAHFNNPEGCPCDLCWKFSGSKLAIALIKGEKK